MVTSPNWRRHRGIGRTGSVRMSGAFPRLVYGGLVRTLHYSVVYSRIAFADRSLLASTPTIGLIFGTS